MESHMNEGWIILGICLILVIGGALPLIRPRNDTPAAAQGNTT